MQGGRWERCHFLGADDAGKRDIACRTGPVQ